MNVVLLRRVAWVTGGAALLLALLTLTRSPLVWRDETQFAALSYSLFNGGGGASTIFAEDPRFPITTFFYGPSFFWLGAYFFKLFGFSVFSFRLLSWVGGLLLALAAAALARVLGGSRNWAAACWVLALLSPELGSTLANGRMDTLAVAGELVGLALLLRGLQTEKPVLSWGCSALAGLVWAATVLTTPRSLQFFLCLALAALWWARDAAWRKFAARFVLAGGLTAAGLVAWLWSQGETPFSWLSYMSRIASFTRSNTIIGGFWSLRPTLLWVLTPLVCALLLVFRRRNAGPQNTARAWATTAIAGQSLLTFVTTVRPESYPVYWGVPLLVVALTALSAGARARYAMGALVLAACLFGGLRVVKLAEVAASWKARDPQPLEAFARQHIPPGSRVIGPAEHYFYAVERAGSTYRFHELLRDAYFPFLEDRQNPLYAAAQQQKFAAHFLWWPDGKPLPRSCGCSEADRVATYAPPSVSSRFGFGGGYPASSLYRIKPPELF
jgi:4-amino-4-deoxy-L-arabinose transferase-like glycosyltransferase